MVSHAKSTAQIASMPERVKSAKITRLFYGDIGTFGIGHLVLCWVLSGEESLETSRESPGGQFF